MSGNNEFITVTAFAFRTLFRKLRVYWNLDVFMLHFLQFVALNIKTLLQVLAENRAFLASKDLRPYIPHLKTKYIMSIDDQEEVESLTTTRQKSDKIIDILLRRGNRAYDELCQAMIDLRVDAQVVIKLNLELERRKAEVFPGKQSLLQYPALPIES